MRGPGTPHRRSGISSRAGVQPGPCPAGESRWTLVRSASSAGARGLTAAPISSMLLAGLAAGSMFRRAAPDPGANGRTVLCQGPAEIEGHLGIKPEFRRLPEILAQSDCPSRRSRRNARERSRAGASPGDSESRAARWTDRPISSICSRSRAPGWVAIRCAGMAAIVILDPRVVVALNDCSGGSSRLLPADTRLAGIGLAEGPQLQLPE